MAENDFSLPESLKNEVMSADCISQHNCDAIGGMAKAIAKLTTDPSIEAMAKHIAYLAEDTLNTVNVAAEMLGSNYKERNHV